MPQEIESSDLGFRPRGIAGWARGSAITRSPNGFIAVHIQ
jgi:hypothetical protein